MSDETTGTPPAAPVHFDHYCDYPGCVKWGAFGNKRGHGITEWRCVEPLAADYWDGALQPAKLSDLAQRNKSGHQLKNPAGWPGSRL
jgi:hypothetical protein